jgi:hypothetical protein
MSQPVGLHRRTLDAWGRRPGPGDVLDRLDDIDGLARHLIYLWLHRNNHDGPSTYFDWADDTDATIDKMAEVLGLEPPTVTRERLRAEAAR